MYNDKLNFNNIENKLHHFEVLISEADTVREKDKSIIRSLFSNFYNKRLNVGIGYQRSYGSVLSGDYFDLIKLPDGNYMFVFADISGHGLPAYTTLIRLRSAITIAVKESESFFMRHKFIDSDHLVKDIATKFTDIMDVANSYDFACVVFTFIYNNHDKFHLKFYNRSMLFPFVIRRYNRLLVDIYNLNNNEKGWYPKKGTLLGSDVRELMGGGYLITPVCEFVLYEGDSIMYFSDGITEAHKDDDPSNEFGEARVENVIRRSLDLAPQIIIQELFDTVYEYIGSPEQQKDDMTAVLIEFPLVRG